MSYREQLLEPSFRAVPFAITDVGLSSGRRSATHEYPQRDEAYIEDLGRRTRKFSVSAFVVEPNYLDKRNQLIQALEARGPGTLIHPWYGERTVSVESFSVQEGSSSGGVASFTINFVESGIATFPTGETDTQGQVNIAAEESRVQIRENFMDRFSIVRQPDFLTSDATRVLSEGVASITSSLTGGT